MAARDLDFEEVSVLRERAEALKEGGKQYLQAHPELGQLLGELVSSCQVHRPDDVFAHAASHFSAPEGAAAKPAAAEPAAKPAAAEQYTPAGFGAHYPSEQ